MKPGKFTDFLKIAFFYDKFEIKMSSIKQSDFISALNKILGNIAKRLIITLQ